MKKIFLLFLCLFLTGCAGTIETTSSKTDNTTDNHSSTTEENKTTDNSSTTNQSTSEHQDSIKELAMETFVNSEDYASVIRINNYGFYNFELNDLAYKLEIPSLVVNSVDDLVSILDYCAFYHIEEIQITSNLASFDTEFNKAYWMTSLLPGSVGVDYIKDGNEIKVSFFYADAAKFTFASESNASITPYKFSSAYSYTRGDDFEDFPYLSRDNELSVYNSEQLVYALCQGYKPVCVIDSPAELVLNRAKEILRDIISPEFTDVDKAVAIYNYITSTVVYDDIGDSCFVYGDYNEIFKDEIIASTESNYVEGALFSGRTVCHGNAKLAALLLNMEGIESHKVSGYYSYYDALETRNPICEGGYYEHGYCYTKIDDNYYITDPTYAFGGGYPNFTLKRDSAILINKSDWQRVYTLCNDFYSEKYLCASPSLLGTDISFLEDSNGNMVSLHITSEEDMQRVIDAVSYLLEQNPNTSFAFVVQVSSSNYDLCRNMIRNSSFSEKLNYAQRVNYIGTDYAFALGVNS